MAALFGEQVTLGQENGPEIELLVWGDEHYARYETPDGYSVVYEPDAGLFMYAYIEDGAFASSGIPATADPPEGAVLHGVESPEVRLARAQAPGHTGRDEAERETEEPPPRSEEQ